MDELLTAAHFTPHLGKIVRFKGTPYAFPLDRVEGGDDAPPPGFPRAPFVAIFRGPRDGVPMPEGLYDGEIEGGPTYSLYVTPIHTPQPGHQEYQASFN